MTKGLDPDVKMKDSELTWLGMIPEKWSVKKIKHISTFIGSGKTPKGGSEVYSSDGVVFIRSMNVHNKGLKLDDVVYIDKKIDYDMKSTRVISNDILLNITGASIGRSCIVPTGFPDANVNQHVCIIRPSKVQIYPSLLSKLMVSQTVKDQIDRSQNGSSREGLNFSQVGNIYFPISPDLEEQKNISNYIEEEINNIDRVIIDITRQIKKFEEYRQSLIYEAVTGKIDVRDYPLERKEEAHAD
ncbi:restriction endonuclease subunit S [Piscibacillus salipiscarius]|uniref:restriction endonuclease subunit S n=1 Tax=Piscibacillus salipiscarius TaxID=299480 RepID=UPI0006D1745D|nr:restriction endonuclease subunit S [Piscibacillus salipiscarius]